MADPTLEPLPPNPTLDERARQLVGQVISQRYRVDEIIARGGMGTVFLGYHLLLKKRVAIKILHRETEHLPELMGRFEREAIAGAHIVHPNVATATDFGQLDDGSYFLVLEYVAGRTLHSVIQEGRLDPARVLHLARQLASGLSAAHEMGIVHRDLKPRNIILADNPPDQAKLIDFGLAKVPVDQVVAELARRAPTDGATEDATHGRTRRQDSNSESRPRLTGVGVIFGTVAYLAPEAALGMNAVDARADLYALGLLIYEMLTGKHPFDAADDAELFRKQRFVPPPPMSVRAPEAAVPPAFESLVMRLLAKDPTRRYQTAGELVAALDAVATAMKEPTPDALATPRTSKGRPSLPFQVGLALTALVLGVGAFLVLRLGPMDPAGSSASARAHQLPSEHAALASDAPKPSTTPLPSATIEEHAPAASAPGSAPLQASAVPDAAPPEPPKGDGETARLRALLLRALRVRDWRGGEAAFLSLAEHDPTVFHTADNALAARDLATALDREGIGDRIFEVLTNRLGPDGLDVLYDLVATKGRSAAAQRAASVLRDPKVFARASKPLAIAFELREASCANKLGLMARAVEEGDGRALVVLETQGVACFKKNNRIVTEAMTALRQRLLRKP